MTGKFIKLKNSIVVGFKTKIYSALCKKFCALCIKKDVEILLRKL